MNPVDPTPFNPAAWGIFSILAFVIAGLIGIVWRIFAKMSSDQAKRDESQVKRDEVLMNFVDTHRGESNKALSDLGAQVVQSYRELRDVITEQMRFLERQGVTLNEMLAQQRVVAALTKMRDNNPGKPITHEDIERVVMGVLGDLKVKGVG